MSRCRPGGRSSTGVRGTLRHQVRRGGARGVGVETSCRHDPAMSPAGHRGRRRGGLQDEVFSRVTRSSGRGESRNWEEGHGVGRQMHGGIPAGEVGQQPLGLRAQKHTEGPQDAPKGPCTGSHCPPPSPGSSVLPLHQGPRWPSRSFWEPGTQIRAQYLPLHRHPHHPGRNTCPLGRLSATPAQPYSAPFFSITVIMPVTVSRETPGSARALWKRRQAQDTDNRAQEGRAVGGTRAQRGTPVPSCQRGATRGGQWEGPGHRGGDASALEGPGGGRQPHAHMTGTHDRHETNMT